MILRDKVAVIYGATGSVGQAVAMQFATEGAIVFLAARNPGKLKALSDKIGAAGGRCYHHVVDVLQQQEVEAHLQMVRGIAAVIDISMNLVGINDVQGQSLAEISFADFMLPVQTAMQAQFYITTAAARVMVTQGKGVILLLTAQAAKLPYSNTGGFAIAGAAMEALGRQLAKEFGDKGIRVVCLRSSGSPDAEGVAEVFNLHAAQEGISRQEFEERFARRTMLKKLPSLQDVANTASIMASGYAAALTATIVNVTCGEIAD